MTTEMFEPNKAHDMEFAVWEHDFPSYTEEEIPNIILDMDLGGDSDDLGAIAIVYYYHQQGLVNLLATTSPREIWYAGAMSAINTYYGYPDMPMGFNGNKYNNFSYAAYGRYLTTHFSNPLLDKLEYRHSVPLMREILSKAEDHSVTFCATGNYNNLYKLLLSEADEYSNLSGEALVKKKVKWVVAMGGKFPEGVEANIKNDVEAAVYVNKNWPTPILYCGWEIGDPVLTACRETLDRMDVNNPIRAGYEEHYKNLHDGIPRPSWDPLTAYFACIGYDTYYELQRGDVSIDASGCNYFYANKASGARAYLTRKSTITNEEMAAILDDIIVKAEGRINNGVICNYIEVTDDRLIKNSTDSTTETVTHTLWGHSWHDTYYQSNDKGATITLPFDGKNVVIYGGYLPSGGMVDIYIDDTLEATVDTYKATESLSSYIFSKQDLSANPHTLKIVTRDEANAAASGNAFLLDFIKVDRHFEDL